MYKEFDIERAKKGDLILFKSDISNDFNTQIWREARTICFDRQSEKNKWPIVALVKFETIELACVFDINGVDPAGNKRLFMAPVKREEWVNVFKRLDGFLQCSEVPFATKEEAEISAGDAWKLINTVLIHEWEE